MKKPHRRFPVLSTPLVQFASVSAPVEVVHPRDQLLSLGDLQYQVLFSLMCEAPVSEYNMINGSTEFMRLQTNVSI